MPRSSERSYGGLSAEQRRAERRARLIDAALDALAASDWRSITVDKLCLAAGLNKRYFYESFTDLDAVAAAAVDDIAADVSAATLAAAAGAAGEPVDRQAEAAVDAVVRNLVADPRRARVLLGGVAASPALHRHREAVMRGLTSVLVGHARTVHGVELERDPLAEVAPAFVIGGTADAILAFVDGRAKVTIDELVAGLATLWLITGNGAADVARSRVAPNG
ncbi:transcriptional regulator [Mycobacterium sp. NAZ190054]|uniref:transcriptional regulator n=1 Tax=Mycobacterium sp. NAZ190054 TaxID=1747766 RepID=UPI000791A3C0|nr:transcriptional regulator [Mycobacterium sp. NAZ190054]KWX60230.1 transcriptional regulator [Mycobacterium sp. NAZ190054]